MHEHFSSCIYCHLLDLEKNFPVNNNKNNIYIILMDLMTPSPLTCQFVNFVPTSNTELSKIANNIIMKSCILDPLPPTLLKQYFYLLLPIIILKIVNLSLESGHFPSSLNTAVLSPLLKKAN